MKKYIYYAIFLLMLLSGLAFTINPNIFNNITSQNQIKENFYKGYKSFNESYYDIAEDYFLDVLSYNNNHFLANKMLGYSQYYQGNITNALQTWEHLLEKTNYEDIFLDSHFQNLQKQFFKNITTSERQFIFHSKLSHSLKTKFTYPTFIVPLEKSTLILATDYLNNGMLLEIDVNKKIIRSLKRGSEKLELPISAVELEKEIWVADYKINKIHRFDKNSTLISNLFSQKDPIGKAGSQPLEFRGIVGMCKLNEYIYVVDSRNNRIQRLAINGEFNLEFSNIGSSTHLYNPFGIVCLSNEQVWVSEPEQQRISIFDKYGNYISKIDSVILENGTELNLKKPKHLFFNKDKQEIFITDEEQGVIIFNIKKQNHSIITGYEENEVFHHFNRPISAIKDSHNNLIIADYANSEIVYFKPDTHFYANLNVMINKIHTRNFPQVHLWVTVNDAENKPVDYLLKNHFKIGEEGRSISDFGFKRLNSGYEWIFLISNTTAMQKYQTSLNWILDILFEKIYENEKIKLITYDEHSYAEKTDWRQSKLLLKKILQTKKKGTINTSTNNNCPQNAGACNIDLGEIIYFTQNNFIANKDKHKAIIWLHEGSFSSQHFQSISQEQLENLSNIHNMPIYSISFKNKDIPDYRDTTLEIKNFITNTGGKYFNFENPNLKNLFNILRKQKSYYYTLYYNSGLPENLDTPFKVQVNAQFQNLRGATENLLLLK